MTAMTIGVKIANHNRNDETNREERIANMTGVTTTPIHSGPNVNTDNRTDRIDKIRRDNTENNNNNNENNIDNNENNNDKYENNNDNDENNNNNLEEYDKVMAGTDDVTAVTENVPDVTENFTKVTENVTTVTENVFLTDKNKTNRVDHSTKKDVEILSEHGNNGKTMVNNCQNNGKTMVNNCQNNGTNNGKQQHRANTRSDQVHMVDSGSASTINIADVDEHEDEINVHDEINKDDDEINIKFNTRVHVY